MPAGHQFAAHASSAAGTWILAILLSARPRNGSQKISKLRLWPPDTRWWIRLPHLATHLGEIIRQNAHELLTRQETKRLIDRLSESHPKLVEELVPKLMTLGEVQKVLQQLLREQVSIRDLGTILETLVETAGVSKNPVLLNEAVRHALGRALVRPLLDEHGELKVVTLDRAIEEECNRAMNAQSVSAASMASAAFNRPPRAGRTAHAVWRTGAERSSGIAVLIAGPLLLTQIAGTIFAQDRSAGADRDSAAGASAVGGFAAITNRTEDAMTLPQAGYTDVLQRTTHATSSFCPSSPRSITWRGEFTSACRSTFRSRTWCTRGCSD